MRFTTAHTHFSGKMFQSILKSELKCSIMTVTRQSSFHHCNSNERELILISILARMLNLVLEGNRGEFKSSYNFLLFFFLWIFETKFCKLNLRPTTTLTVTWRQWSHRTIKSFSCLSLAISIFPYFLCDDLKVKLWSYWTWCCRRALSIKCHNTKKVNSCSCHILYMWGPRR